MEFRHRSKAMLITGGSGFLGRHLQRSESMTNWQLIAPGSGSLDVRQGDRVMDAIKDWKPPVVVHLAYDKQDSRCTVDGSRNVARAAAAIGARLIHLSSDVIFPGREAPYTERDSPFPITDYARMKVAAEREVMDTCPGAVMIRTSLMYGTDIVGHSQVDVQRALSGAVPMAFYTNEYRCPVHADDVAAAIATLASVPTVSGPLHVAGPEALSRADYARAIARWLGSNPMLLHTDAVPDGGFDRPGRVILDSSLAATYGIRCRPISEAMR